MSAVVADTHVAVWYLRDSKKLSERARAVLDETARAGDFVYVPSISVVEVTYLVEKRKLPEEALQTLTSELASPISALEIAPLDFAVARAIQRVPRDDVPDMPDRIIAATALSLNLPLVTRDKRIQAALIKTIW